MTAQKAPNVWCGAGYRVEVGDSRYSGSESIVRKPIELGADMPLHEPDVDQWRGADRGLVPWRLTP